MKIDTELRHTIIATARANAKLPNGDRENKQAAVDILLSKGKGKKMLRDVLALQEQIDELEAQQQVIVKKRNALFAPYGLDLCERSVGGKKEHYLRLGWGDEDAMAFVKQGGVLPNPERRNWSADELLRKLAAAKTQKEFDALLKEYGIHWS